ncbi:elongation factor 1-alpha isoform X2 [Punica granatum]|uniref:Elongation factor 1-alpha isoform X2 n=1 Tax=Punica granatum TaxID=22663 RepID=A0A6P8BRD7_PUNGR|nr:elongation factor 1-alpha isoform X2 [Punica granatum]
MPRKVFDGVDYDDGYDDDYDYDDLDDADYYGKAQPSEPVKETIKRGTWSCPICTYDNDESMTACDICGVFRNPLPHMNNNHDKKTVPFKFDAPSPDDIVSNGLRSSKTASKATAKTSDSSSAKTQWSKTNNVEDNNHVKDGVLRLQANNKASASSSISKESIPSMESSSKLSTGNEQLGDQVSGASSRRNRMGEGTPSVEEIRPQSHNRGMSKSDLPSKSRAPYKPEKWMLPEKEGSDLNQLNLAIVGHVDSGKSTLSGRLLHLLGRISQKQMHKYEKEAKIQGKGSFAYAWALDESPEERERGITMTVGVAYFDTKNYHVVVLDSPGHKDFIPNMISGATQADAAILVIDASIGSFEAGVDPTKGQTREHAQLIRSFGVDQLIVAINKMDVVEYSKERYDTIKQKLGAFLRLCGFKDLSVLWIPLSAMENQNLVSASSDARLRSWYQGPHLLDAIDSLQPPTRDISKPVVMPVCDVVKSQSTGQVSAIGKLASGALRSGSKVLVMPSGDVGTVRSLERDSRPCTVARAGDNVSVVLHGVEETNIMSGDVLCHPEFPVPTAKHVELKVLVLDGSAPIVIGSQLEFHVHHAKEAARVVKIISLLDPKTGKASKKTPRCLVAKQSAILEVVLNGSVCAEEYSNCKALGRVSLRSLGRTVAVGVITRLIED